LVGVDGGGCFGRGLQGGRREGEEDIVEEGDAGATRPSMPAFDFKQIVRLGPNCLGTNAGASPRRSDELPPEALGVVEAEDAAVF
jgi:hypothetical protein